MWSMLSKMACKCAQGQYHIQQSKKSEEMIANFIDF